MRFRRLHPGQLRLREDGARFKAAMFGRRWGKNVYGIDTAQRKALEGKAVGWFEPTYKYLLEAWAELVRRLMPLAARVSDQEKRIELINGGLVEAWTCDTPDPGRSRAYDHAIINEAGLIRGLRGMWQASIRPTLTDRRGSADFLGTPKGASHDFSLMHLEAEGDPEWAAFRGPTSENPYILREEIEAAKRELPPDIFAQEYEGIPAPDGGNPFGVDSIRACLMTVEESLKAQAAQTVAWGWDFARAQDWTVGIGLDRLYRVTRFHRWQRLPWGETKRDVVKHTANLPAWGDSTGVGDAVVEDLQRAGCPMIGVTFSRPEKQRLMERLAGAIQQRKVRFPDGPIRAELEAFGYEYTASGVKYTGPAGMHDDCVMALALAVYGRDQFGVIPEPEVERPVPLDKHPGWDWDRKERKPRWAKSLEPEEPVTGYTPGRELVEL